MLELPIMTNQKLKPKFFIIIALMLLMCSRTNERVDKQYICNQFERMANNDIPVFLENDFPDNWYSNNQVFIHEDNPGFQINNFDSLKFIIVPALNIPVSELAGFEANITEYFNMGEMSVYKAGELLVFENDTLLLKFNIHFDEIEGRQRRAFNKSDYSSYLKNTPISVFEGSDAYFNVNIVDDEGAIFAIPTGTFLLRDNTFSVIMPAGKVYDMDNMHKLLFENKKEFNSYIKNIVALLGQSK
jgi:hypothetical protein